ncbi:hypothetical protein CMEL01_16132 [Colletotrichum melonis]|uniref:Uncharacterized protein n=1 Tax=Colletotrichum melonis TaxID=1209925 RepID=A0AAI9UJH8_9PEZI|nr:hypothetical protein CMEL01_16132 [Colletotrichum melonis]
MTGISKHGMQQGCHFGESASVLFLAKKWFVISIRSCPLPCKTQYVPQSNHHRLSQPPSETVQLSLCVSTLSLCLFVARLERPLVDLHGFSFALPLRNRPPPPPDERKGLRIHILRLPSTAWLSALLGVRNTADATPIQNSPTIHNAHSRSHPLG